MGLVAQLLITGCFAGMLGPLIVIVFYGKTVDWTKRLEAPTWDFSKSWASNLTAAGTVLGYAALLAVFAPTATFAFGTRQGYLSVGIMAGGLVILAPLVFNIISRVMRNCSQKADGCALLIGSWITLWGLVVQLLLGVCLVWELKACGVVPAGVATSLTVLVGIFAFGAVMYGAMTVSDTLCKEPAETEIPEIIGTVVSRRRRWSLL